MLIVCATVRVGDMRALSSSQTTSLTATVRRLAPRERLTANDSPQTIEDR